MRMSAVAAPRTTRELRHPQFPTGAGRVGDLAYCGEVEAVSDRRPAVTPTACAGEWE